MTTPGPNEPVWEVKLPDAPSGQYDEWPARVIVSRRDSSSEAEYALDANAPMFPCPLRLTVGYFDGSGSGVKGLTAKVTLFAWGLRVPDTVLPATYWRVRSKVED